jgi:hypothetical protein
VDCQTGIGSGTEGVGALSLVRNVAPEADRDPNLFQMGPRVFAVVSSGINFRIHAGYVEMAAFVKSIPGYPISGPVYGQFSIKRTPLRCPRQDVPDCCPDRRSPVIHHPVLPRWSRSSTLTIGPAEPLIRSEPATANALRGKLVMSQLVTAGSSLGACWSSG